MKKKSWYEEWWGITSALAVILFLVFTILYLSIPKTTGTDNVISKDSILNSNTNSENTNSENTNSESTNIAAVTYDCTKENYVACEGTTNVVHKFESIGGDCSDSPVKTDNSFDCGYITPCDKIVCEAKTSFSCDGTTKTTTEYSCDKKQGCISTSQASTNDKSCGYEETHSGKYTSKDLNVIRQLANQCKFNLDDCGKDYYFPAIKIGEQELVNPNTNEPYYTDINLNGVIATPFLMAVLVESQKELIYESYTDKELLLILDWNSLNVSLILDASTIYGMGELGSIETVVIKYNGEVYNSESSQSNLYTIKGYSEIYDKKVELVIVGSKKEVSTIVDLSGHK